MDDMGNTNTDRKLMALGLVFTIMAPRRRRAPAIEFPPSPTPRVHHTSILDFLISPVSVHELSKVFSAVN